ncbi:MAG: hypothetical protein FWH22_10790, partial [Fibromonadales bacterium]|nr:hypothetical protein [Fibromonadales bacterium]
MLKYSFLAILLLIALSWGQEQEPALCGGEKYNPETHYCSWNTVREYGYVKVGDRNYKTVVIGAQTWMAENLNYAGADDEIECEVSSDCDTYTHEQAMEVCPEGWHLPSRADWMDLRDVGQGWGELEAGKHLKAKSGWNPPGEDTYGFA